MTTPIDNFIVLILVFAFIFATACGIQLYNDEIDKRNENVKIEMTNQIIERKLQQFYDKDKQH